jgi:hypothetical protein
VVLTRAISFESGIQLVLRAAEGRLEIGEVRRRGDGVSGIFLVSPQNARCSSIGAESRGDVIDE